MVAPYVIPAITGGLGIIGSAMRGSGPTYQPDERLRRMSREQTMRYRDMAMGQGPSVGRGLLQQGLDRGMAQQRAMAQSARGGALQQQLARRQAQMTGARMAGQTAQQAAILGAQEQQQAMRGLDRSLASEDAQRMRDYLTRRGEFEAQGQHLGNIFSAVGDVGRIPGLLGGGR